MIQLFRYEHKPNGFNILSISLRDYVFKSSCIFAESFVCFLALIIFSFGVGVPIWT